MQLINPIVPEFMIASKNFVGDGIATSFDLGKKPIWGSEFVHKGGLLQKYGTGNDYTISGTQVVFIVAPAANIPIDIRYFRNISGLGLIRESFSGDGASTQFTLTFTPISEGEFVYKGGLLQKPGASNDYTISGSIITFATAPVSGINIEVRYFRGESGQKLSRISLVGDGVKTSFPVIATIQQNRELIYRGGAIQKIGSGNDYTLSPGAIVFSTPPANNNNIEVRFFS